MKKLLTAIIFFCIASNCAIAGDSYSGKIQQILITSSGYVFFRAGDQNPPAACSPSQEWAFQLVGVNANGGKAMLAQLLAAQASNKEVRVVGSGVCDIIGDRQTVGYIIVI